MEPLLEFIKYKNEVFVRVDKSMFDLKKLCQKFGTPLDIEFLGLFEKRLDYIFHTFEELKSKYRLATRLIYFYPIKVNPRKEIIESIKKDRFNIGFEVGNEFELSMIKKWTLKTQPKGKTKVICHGSKLDEYVKLGKSQYNKALYVQYVSSKSIM